MDRISVKNILITGAGAPGFVGIFKALRVEKDLHISTCDIRQDVVGRSLADAFFTLPAGDSPEYIDQLIGECTARNIDTILPITTRELIPIATAADRLRAHGIHPIISSAHSLEVANSKCALFRHLQQRGLPIAPHRLIRSWADLKAAVDERVERNSPFVLKPCIGNGSRGVRIIDPQRDTWRDFFEQKPSSLHMDATQLLELFHGRNMPPMLIMDLLEGPEYSVDCLLDHGRPVCIIPRLRLRINNGISVEGRIEKNPEVIAYCEQLLAALELHGPIGIQLKFAGGEPYLLEINPRLQGTSSACLKAGINLPELALRLQRAELLEREEVEASIRWGTHFVRHYEEEVLP